MEEIFDIIKAVNLLKDQVEKLNIRIDNLSKNPHLFVSGMEVDEKTASKLLHVGIRELQRMRKKGEISFIRHHRKILYPVDSINRYLKEKTIQSKISA